MQVTSQVDTLFKLPEIFPFGRPRFDGGTITTAFLLTLLLITNTIASIRLMETIMEQKQMDNNRYLRAGLTSGITHFIGGCLGAIGSVPISGAKIPAPIGYSVTFVIFVKMVGLP